MTEVVSVETFYKRLTSFMTRMGEKKWTAEERQNGFKMLTLSYLRLDADDPKVKEAEKHYIYYQEEYVTRMTMLNMSC